MRHRATSQGHSGGRKCTFVESMFGQSLVLWPKSYSAAVLRGTATARNTLHSVLSDDSGAFDFVWIWRIWLLLQALLEFNSGVRERSEGLSKQWRGAENVIELQYLA